MVSIADRNSETGGRSSGFDYLRMALSFLVMCWHSVSTSYEEQADFNLWAGPARPFLGLLMPMFFALSGYLVAWSLFRSKTLLKFILFRMMRIYPALFVETVLSALVLGPLLTTLSLKDYFSDPRFYSYMLNIVGDVHYFLPGLFESNPFPHVVNNQLWTIPYELLSYLALAALSLLGLKRWRILSALAPVVLTLAYLVIRIYRRGELPEHPTTLNGPLLVITFLAGVAIFSYAERIPWSLWLFAALRRIFNLRPEWIDGYGIYSRFRDSIHGGLLHRLSRSHERSTHQGIVGRRLFLWNFSVPLRDPAGCHELPAMEPPLVSQPGDLLPTHAGPGDAVMAVGRKTHAEPQTFG